MAEIGVGLTDELVCDFWSPSMGKISIRPGASCWMVGTCAAKIPMAPVVDSMLAFG